MTKTSMDRLKEAIESQHGGIATHVESVPVRETYNGQTVWEGLVHVFDLTGHPKSTRAYAWSYVLPDDKHRFIAVLHGAPILSPRDAVRASIVAEHRKG